MIAQWSARSLPMFRRDLARTCAPGLRLQVQAAELVWVSAAMFRVANRDLADHYPPAYARLEAFPSAYGVIGFEEQINLSSGGLIGAHWAIRGNDILVRPIVKDGPWGADVVQWSQAEWLEGDTEAFVDLIAHCLTMAFEPSPLPPKAAKRQLAGLKPWRPQAVGGVTIVSLRTTKPAEPQEKPLSSVEREYTHRWRQRGHYRMQAYGPGRSLHKRIWIAPQVKGPAHLPIVEKDVVSAWRR